MAESDKSVATLNDDDYLDYSRWSSFFNEHIVFFNNATLEECLKDMKAEIVAREINHD